MKIIMQVGREYWAAPDFSSAMKVAHELSKCQPLHRHYLPQAREVFTKAAVGEYPHEVTVRTMADSVMVSEKDAEKARAKSETEGA